MSWLEAGNHADLVIADLNMPNLNGKEFIKVVHASSFFNDLPTLILLETYESEERIECLNLGIEDFMIKPFNPREAQAKVKAILKRTKLWYASSKINCLVRSKQSNILISSL